MRARWVAVVFRGDPGAALSPRLRPMAEAVEARGLRVRPVPFVAGAESEVAATPEGVDGALVWADPLADSGDRACLDEVLRSAESAGLWVSSRPDVIDRLGTKRVLVTTRQLGWGSDCHMYEDSGQLERDFPPRLAAHGVRVLKADRGNGGRTVWKVRLPGGPSPTPPTPETMVVAQHARVRDGAAETMSLRALLQLIEDADVFSGWAGRGCLVDQEFIPDITSGIVRCYVVGDQVVGFARQYPEGLLPDGPLGVMDGSTMAPDEVMGLPSPKTMYPPDEPALASLRRQLEGEWIPSMMERLDLEREDLPALWDADLIPRAAQPDGSSAEEPLFTLCEINASCVIPFPHEAPAKVAAHVHSALARRQRG